MPNYVLNRNHAYQSLHGHSFNFIKGQPTHVPPICEKEVIAIGAEPVDGQDKAQIALGDEAVATAPELTHAERAAVMEAAFEDLERSNTRGDFTGGGMPSLTALKRVCGFEPSKAEREAVWLAYRDKKAKAE